MTAARVLLDATPIPSDRAGVGRYVDSLVAELVRTDLDLVVVAKPEDAAGFERMGARVVRAPAMVRSTAARLLWEQLGLPRLARALDRSVVHSVHYTFPLLTRLKRVVTIHDLTFFTLPEVHTRVKAPFFRWWLSRAAATRDVSVVAVSEATASEFERITGAPRSKVTVARLGYDPEVFHPPTATELAALRLRLGVDRWIAFLGTLEPRKNVVALVRAYDELAGRSAVPPLLLAGSAGWDQAVPGALADARRAGRDIRTLGYLDLEELHTFLGGAELVVYPSLGEGFGLPVLESMASGAAVLTTRELSLPEVGGDAVEYSGTDSQALGAAIERLLDDPVRRAHLRELGVRRAADFSWAKTARAHRAAYDAG
jgi:glycosyltransferase involved in cell wall biosynthesis